MDKVVGANCKSFLFLFVLSSQFADDKSLPRWKMVELMLSIASDISRPSFTWALVASAHRDYHKWREGEQNKWKTLTRRKQFFTFPSTYFTVANSSLISFTWQREKENEGTQNGFQARFTWWWRDESFLRTFCRGAVIKGRWTRWELIWNRIWFPRSSATRWLLIRLLSDQWNRKFFS